MRIKAQIVISLGAMLALLTGVAGVSIDRTDQIGRLAGDLNRRVVDKTRIAANILDLSQQIRSADAMLLRSTSLEQDASVDGLAGDRIKAMQGWIESYAPFVDSGLERRLLQNLRRDRAAYLDARAGVMARRAAEGLRVSDEADLAAASDATDRQARGLSHLAEAQARATRDEVADLVIGAHTTILVSAAFAVAIGLLILGLLVVGVFRPLARITDALIALSRGRLDVPALASGRGDEVDDVARALDIFRQNALALSAAHDRAELLARRDVLTGLPNRRDFTAGIESAIARSKQCGSACSVLVLGLDRFKPVNDVLGREAGDRLLSVVGDRLRGSVRPGETVGRLGGDEFALVVEHKPGSQAPRRVAERAISSVSAAIDLGQRKMSVRASIGIALWPSDGVDADALLHAADLAMAQAKRDARGSFRSFEPEMDLQLKARADLELRIEQAIRSGAIQPHYQPLVALRDGRIVGFEVLARWRDGERILMPGAFLPVAEEAGLMPDLTFAILRRACRDARNWPDHLTLAVNVTPGQIVDLRFPEIVLSIAAAEGFRPSRLELEITEDALIGDMANAKSVVETLRGEGVTISLDDFGTGYASLHHLRSLKFDKLKIDRSFVQSMSTDAESMTIVETVLGLTRSLGISAVAEGIETAADLRSLADRGCDFGQGYFLGRPASASSTIDVIHRARAGTPSVAEVI